MKKINFNQNWLFYSLERPDNVQSICLPHDAMILEMRNPNNPSGPAGAFFPGGRYVYKKKFSADREQGLKWLLEFEGAYNECFVYLNGKLIKSNFNGYINFYADLTENIFFDKENELIVHVNNDKIPNSRWYSGSGLYSPVWLYVGGNVRIDIDGLRISTPDVDKDLSKMDIAALIVNDTSDTVKLRVNTEIYDGDNELVCKENTPVTLFSKERVTARHHIYIKNPRLWSIDSPHLYTCKVKIFDQEGKQLDSIESTFGIRKIQIDPYNGLRINGEKILLRGACIHHDNGIIGAATFYDAEERRIKLLKEAGFNSIRIAHQPCSKAMLVACDKLGMLVFEESFDMWEEGKNPYDYSLYFKENWKEDIKAMVDKDFNHPSVFMYCIGNEIKELAKDEGIRISRQLTEYIRSLDSTRPITNAINGMVAVEGKVLPILMDLGFLNREDVARVTGNADSSSQDFFAELVKQLGSGNINDIMTAVADNLDRVTDHPLVAQKLEEIMSHLDVCGYNYMLSRYPIDIPDYPNRVFVGSETFPPQIDLYWEKCKTYPSLIGDYTWTGWDYIGEAGVGHTNYKGMSKFAADYPGYLAYCGDFDITGYRRPLSYFREIVFGLRKKPYISVQNPKYYDLPAKCTTWAVPETVESWTWKGYAGKPIKVVVYSCDEEVALLLNGKEVGRKKCERFQTTFEITYMPGTLTAVGFTGQKEMENFSLFTADEDIRMDVKLSKEQIRCFDELCFIEIQLFDSNGIKYMDRDRKVSLKIMGPAMIQGFGSGDPYSEENFFDSQRTTFNGRLLAAIRGMDEGTAKIILSAEGCKDVEKEIEVVK